MRKQNLHQILGIALALAAVPASAPLFGCDSQVFAANSTVGVMRRASPGVQHIRDPEIAEAAIPAAIQQSEGLLMLSGDSLELRSSLSRTYGSFGYGFMEEHMEQAEFDGADEAVIEHWRTRASLAYERGRAVAIEAMDNERPNGGGLLAVQRQGLEAFTAHVRTFDRVEHAPILFWAAYNWIRYIGVHRDDMNAIADVPYVIALADRVLELDAAYFDHGPVALRAGLRAAVPPNLGGRPDEAKVAMDQAIELTHRRNLLLLVTEARLCAIPLQDRALYQSLLEEVIAFDLDSYPEQYLANRLAQGRARRYLAEIDNFFEPAADGEATSDESVEATETDAPAEGAE